MSSQRLRRVVIYSLPPAQHWFAVASPPHFATFQAKPSRRPSVSIFFCAKLNALLVAASPLRRRSLLGAFSPGCTNPALSGLIPQKTQRILPARGSYCVLHSLVARRRFAPSRCFYATDEATTGSPPSVRLYCVCVRNGEPVPFCAPRS